MKNFRNPLILAKKELKSYFDSLIAYIVLIVFLLLWEFLFFKAVFLIGETSLRILFDDLPWLFLFLVPAITMGSISQERNEGTLELLLTHPMKEWELLLGKFLGGMSFLLISLLFIFPVGLSLGAFGTLDWGIVWGQFLGAFFMGMVLVSLGICVSSFFKSQITSLLVAVVSIFFLMIFHSDFITNSLPLVLGGILEKLSVSTHFTSMARGVIDLRDLWYFFSATAIFLGIAYLQLLKRKLGNRKARYRSWKLGIVLSIGIIVLVNIVGNRLPGRIDLTADDLYTLSPATEKVIQNLDDLVNITLYASGELPAQLKPTLRDVEDILRDYETLGQGNILVSRKDPSADTEVKQEASSLGVREMQFNVVSQEELQVKNGYLGISVAHGGKNEVIPFIENTADLEYQLTGFIGKLTTTEKKNVVFLSGHGEKDFQTEYSILTQELSDQFEMKAFSFTDATESEGTPVEEANMSVAGEKSLPADTDVLVIAGPTEGIPEEEATVLKSYMENGGATFLLVDPVVADPQSLSANKNISNAGALLQSYGVTFEENLVYDLRSNENVPFRNGFVTYFLPYPLWARVLASEVSPITTKIKSMILPWASSIELDDSKLQTQGLTATKLFTTSPYAGEQTQSFFLDPQQDFPEQNLREFTMALSIQGSEESGKNTRIVAIGDSDFLGNDMVSRSPENLAFGVNAISWLAQEDSLAGIRLKQRALSPLVFRNDTQKSLVKYGNMALAILIPLLFGIIRLVRRKSLRKLTFSSAS